MAATGGYARGPFAGRASQAGSAGRGRGIPAWRAPLIAAGQAVAHAPGYAFPIAAAGMAQHPATPSGKPVAAPSAAPPGQTPPAPGPPPGPQLDSTYYADVASRTANTNDKIAGLQEQGQMGLTALQNQLSSLRQQQPIKEEQTQEKYNNQGLLYSGHLGQALGQLGQSFADKQAGLNMNFQRQQGSRQAEIKALQDALTGYIGGEAAASAARATQATSNDPNAGNAGASPASTAAPAGQVSFGGIGGRTVGAGGGFRRIPGTHLVIGKGGQKMTPQQAHLTPQQMRALGLR